MVDAGAHDDVLDRVRSPAPLRRDALRRSARRRSRIAPASVPRCAGRTAAGGQVRAAGVTDAQQAGERAAPALRVTRPGRVQRPDEPDHLARRRDRRRRAGPGRPRTRSFGGRAARRARRRSGRRSAAAAGGVQPHEGAGDHVVAGRGQARPEARRSPVRPPSSPAAIAAGIDPAERAEGVGGEPAAGGGRPGPRRAGPPAGSGRIGRHRSSPTSGRRAPTRPAPRSGGPARRARRAPPGAGAEPLERHGRARHREPDGVRDEGRVGGARPRATRSAADRPARSAARQCRRTPGPRRRARGPTSSSRTAGSRHRRARPARARRRSRCGTTVNLRSDPRTVNKRPDVHSTRPVVDPREGMAPGSVRPG